jgi:hypothetical protein
VADFDVRANARRLAAHFEAPRGAHAAAARPASVPALEEHR